MRSHYCGKISEVLLGQAVSLCGWVDTTRDHGGVIFVDLRDREGLVQVVFNPEHKAIFEVAQTLRHEFVIQVKGEVCQRPEGTENNSLISGKVEIIAAELSILNTATNLPFQLDDEKVNEATRLEYRFLDLRRPKVSQRFVMRSRICQAIRDSLNEKGFLDIETPFLTKATPEGARDYVVPSRVNPGHFYALPQSPQIFKQLLMMSGFDRYYQITRCFRDEDLRADRQPEFTQLDLEMSFIEEKDVQALSEDIIRSLFKTFLSVDLPNPFPRMTYQEAMSQYGSDKPDLRIPLILVDLDEMLKDVDFKVFSEAANAPDSRVAALLLPKGAKLSRKEIDGYTDFVKIYGAGGLAYIKVNDRSKGKEGLQSPIVKFLPEEVLETLLEKVQANTDDIIFFGAGHANMVNESLGALRIKLGHDLNLLEESWRPLWVVDFPLVEWNADTHRWNPLHHPFTAPLADTPEALLKSPGNCLSRAYDMVLNGSELGGGSIRIHNKEMQLALFHLLDISEIEAEEKFGHLLKGLTLGCPPHGGIAFGIDRIVMIMLGQSNIREVIPFPKTQTGHCLLTDAPAEVAPQYLLDELQLLVFEDLMDEEELRKLKSGELEKLALQVLQDMKKLEQLGHKDIQKLEQLVLRRLIDLNLLKKRKNPLQEKK